MKDKIFYRIGALATVIPVFMLPLPMLVSWLIAVALLILSMFPLISIPFELGFWIYGLITLFSMPFDWRSVVVFLLFLSWFFTTAVTIYAFVSAGRNK